MSKCKPLDSLIMHPEGDHLQWIVSKATDSELAIAFLEHTYHCLTLRLLFGVPAHIGCVMLKLILASELSQRTF